MPDVPPWFGRHRAGFTAALTMLLVAACLAAAAALLRGVHPDAVRAAFAAIPRWRVVLAAALTAASYLALTLYDVLALHLLKRPLPWRTAALAAFTSYALSYNLGLAPLTGGSARYRIYRRAGLETTDVARIVAIAGVAFWAGLVALTGVALWVHDTPLALGSLVLSRVSMRIAGAAILAAIGGLALLCGRGGGALNLFGWTLPLPSARVALLQIGVAALDLAAAGAALFVLVPGLAPTLLPSFVPAYALAIAATFVSHVPGGLGVFEAVMIATLPVDRTSLAAALVAYRIVYYLLPFAGAVASLALFGNEARLRRPLAAARRLASSLSPLLTSVACAAGGAVLLLSGATPSLQPRLTALQAVVPLPFIEASHFGASLVGTALLLLAPGLYRRLDGAFHAARALLLAGALFSLAKGIDYEEATVCLGIAALLQWTRSAFYRRTALVGEPFSAGWLASVVAVVAASIWMGFISYRDVAYANDLWWRFALHGDASRYLRASLGAGVMLAAAALWRSFAPARHPPGGEPLPAAISAVLERAEHTDAMLAFTGDKRFLVADDGTAFLMYQVRGRSWIVMGDPVGERGRWAELVWSIRAMADAAQGRLMLYQISGEMLELAIATGLQIVKYGEEAVVDLAGFAVEGPRMRSLRHTMQRAIREGARFELVPASRVPELLPELECISDAWLDAKNQREKAFSLGRFDPAYLARFDCAVVRHDDRIVAFANLWRTANGAELSVDLMRHAHGAPTGTMDLLFAELMLWGRAQGYRRFSLGLAPLSGIEGRRLAPLWARVAAILFQHGERLYGFRGLRAYKTKFAPAWRPRYVAAPRGVGLCLALRDLARLVGQPPAQAARR